MISFSTNLLKTIKSVANPAKLLYNIILFISLILTFSHSISFICVLGVLFIIIFIGNFLFFLIVFKLIEILYHLFSSILPNIKQLLL